MQLLMLHVYRIPWMPIQKPYLEQKHRALLVFATKLLMLGSMGHLCFCYLDGQQNFLNLKLNLEWEVLNLELVTYS